MATSGMKCNHCRKGIQYGHNVSHSKRRTRKIWLPNLHVYHYRESLKMSRKKVRLCTSCLRIAKEHMRKLAQKEQVMKMQAPTLVQQGPTL